MYAPIGGIEQHLRISEDSPDKPVMLFLHGGPGATTLPSAAAWQPWEEHFVVVHWDQRGSCRTFGRNGADGCGRVNIERLVQDGIEAAEFLIKHLNRKKVLLVGHSWGSVLGALMTMRRPDLFSAYVGAGLSVCIIRTQHHVYRQYLAEAEKTGNAGALAVFRDLGAPPYATSDEAVRLFEWCEKLAAGDGDPVYPRPRPKSPEFTAEDVELMLQGFDFSRNQIYDEMSVFDLNTAGFKFEVPVFVFQGAEDPRAPCELAEDYFAKIEAPHKEFMRFEGCHHFFPMNRPDDFLRELLARVRPRI